MSQPLSWWIELIILDIWQGNLKTKAEIEDAIDTLIEEVKKNENTNNR